MNSFLFLLFEFQVSASEKGNYVFRIPSYGRVFTYSRRLCLWCFEICAVPYNILDCLICSFRFVFNARKAWQKRNDNYFLYYFNGFSVWFVAIGRECSHYSSLQRWKPRACAHDEICRLCVLLEEMAPKNRRIQWKSEK